MVCVCLVLLLCVCGNVDGWSACAAVGGVCGECECVMFGGWVWWLCLWYCLLMGSCGDQVSGCLMSVCGIGDGCVSYCWRVCSGGRLWYVLFCLAKVHIKDPLLLIRKSILCGNSYNAIRLNPNIKLKLVTQIVSEQHGLDPWSNLKPKLRLASKGGCQFSPLGK